MIVRNVNGTKDNTCKCGSWLKHWEKLSGQSLPATCPVSGCHNKPEVGAHVQRDDTKDRNWYIIPLCSEHNVSGGGGALVGDSINLAPANVSQTCG